MLRKASSPDRKISIAKQSTCFSDICEGGELMQKDPVCGMMVDEKKTKLQSTYQGKNYYFCSSSCKTTFDKAPQKYASK